MRLLPAPALGRPAAAGGDRPRAGDEAGADAVRRADQRPGPGDGRRGARGDPRARPGRHDDGASSRTRWASPAAWPTGSMMMDEGRVVETGPPGADAGRARARSAPAPSSRRCCTDVTITRYAPGGGGRGRQPPRGRRPGLAMLERGGNAVDAAIAAAAVMAVTSPHMCGLGGDLFALVTTAPGAAAPAALNASGRAGSGADPARLRAERRPGRCPSSGDIRSVTVPGCVDGLVALHERFGTLPLAGPAGPGAAAGRRGLPGLADAGHRVRGAGRPELDGSPSGRRLRCVGAGACALPGRRARRSARDRRRTVARASTRARRAPSCSRPAHGEFTPDGPARPRRPTGWSRCDLPAFGRDAVDSAAELAGLPGAGGRLDRRARSGLPDPSGGRALGIPAGRGGPAGRPSTGSRCCTSTPTAATCSPASTAGAARCRLADAGAPTASPTSTATAARPTFAPSTATGVGVSLIMSNARRLRLRHRRCPASASSCTTAAWASRLTAGPPSRIPAGAPARRTR